MCLHFLERLSPLEVLGGVFGFEGYDLGRPGVYGLDQVSCRSDDRLTSLGVTYCRPFDYRLCRSCSVLGWKTLVFLVCRNKEMEKRKLASLSYRKNLVRGFTNLVSSSWLLW
jgi:hypothetical protein